MPNDWSQRLRQLSDMSKNRETLSRLTASAPIPNRFSKPSPTAPPSEPSANPFADPRTPSGTNPFAPAAVHPAPYSDPWLPPAPMEAPAKPPAVRAAYLSLLVAAALILVQTALITYAIAELKGSVSNLMNMDPSHTATLLASDCVGDAQIVVTVIVAAIGALFAAAYLFFARAIWKGRSWPRKVSPFLAILSLPALFIGPVAVAAVCAGTVATAAAWMPA